jgi:hypothetical protein
MWKEMKTIDRQTVRTGTSAISHLMKRERWKPLAGWGRADLFLSF